MKNSIFCYKKQIALCFMFALYRAGSVIIRVRSVL